MTIKDIARLSGYSLGTVSRVLNNHPDVSETARRRVLEVVKEQGFEPNSNARHLKMRNPSSVAVLVKGSQNLLFLDILERIQARFELSGEEVYVAYLDEDEDEVKYAISLSKQRNPKGFLFLGGDMEFFRRGFDQIDVPCVLLTNNAESLGAGNLSSFSTDDGTAAEEVMDYLYSCGHENIGVIGGNLSIDQISYGRLKGVKRSAENHGQGFELEKQYEPCRFSMAEGYEAAKRLLERSPGITALFALGDVIALGAMRAAADMGLSIPGDISIVGFDGTASSEYSIPRLTTVKQDTEQLADRGVRTLLQSIHYELPTVHEYVPYMLIKRESVAELAT